MYERYASSLLAVCIRYMGSRDEAEDTLHDVFIKVFDKIGGMRYRSDAELAAWIRKVCVNHCLDALRKRRLRTFPLQEADDIPDDNELDAEKVRGIPQALLLKMVSELPEGYRTVFNLHCIEEMPHKDIGRLLGIAEKSSSSQYTRARAMLAKQIKEYLNEKED